MLIVALLGTCGLTPVPCTAQDSGNTTAVRGVVLNSLNHEPVARALVESGGDAVLTDSTGHFELNLQSGSVAAVSVRRPGYAFGPSSNHTVRAGEGAPELTFYLTPQAVIAGHISASTGEDAEGTRVIVYRRRNRRGQQWWETHGQAETDSAGHFRISTLHTPAEYLLLTVPTTDRDGRSQADSSTFGYPPVFYPDGAETSGTGLLSLAPGQQVNVELSLTRQPFFPVTIQVKNDVGATPLFVQVHDETGLVSDFPAQWNAQKRSAQVDLPNGQYFAELRSYNRPELYGRVEFTVAGGPVTGLSVVVLPLHSVLVQIRKDFSSSIEGQPEVANGRLVDPAPLGRQANPGLSITLIPIDSALGQVGTLEPVPGTADPSLFQLNGIITPGRYWVRTAPFEGYVGSITSGGVDLSREALTIGPGNTTPPLEVTLRNDTAQIHCTVQRSAALEASASVNAAASGIVSIFAIPTLPTTAATIQGSPGVGNDTTLSVGPGTYRVVALDEYVDIDDLEPAEWNAYLSRGQSVTVEAQGLANVTLDLIAASETVAGSEAAQ